MYIEPVGTSIGPAEIYRVISHINEFTKSVRTTQIRIEIYEQNFNQSLGKLREKTS